MFDLTYSSEPVFFRRASRSSPLFPQLISQESYGICIWRKLIRAKNGCTETPQHRALLCYLRQLGSGSSAAAVRLKARKMAGRCLSQHTSVPNFRSSNRAGFRCSVQRFGCWRLEVHPTALEKVQAQISAGKGRLLDIHASLPVGREQARFSLDQALYCRRGKWSRRSHCHFVCGGIYGDAERPRMASL